MKTSCWAGAMVAVCSMGLVLATGSWSGAQQPGRQPTRQVGGQPGQPGAGLAEIQAQISRQQVRRVQGGPGTTTPTLDQGTGQYRMQRQVVLPGLRRMPVRPQSRWRLGLHTDNAPKGLLVTDVAPNSPAFRFGLEPGDYLLDVMGYPVGFYDGAYYPLAEALNQVVRRDGWVNILIWNRRTNAEEAVWIQAERRQGGVPFGAPGRSEN